MRVLLLGATGNVGSRLVPALLTHGHSVVAYVRSSSKLESILPASVFQQLIVVQGDASDSAAINKAILNNKCDAVVNTAGVAAAAPWGKSDLPIIFRAVLDAARKASEERGSPLRVWFLAGMGVLNYPGTESLLSNYMPVFLEHRQNYQLLKSLPPNVIDWSMLCPMTMVPESSDLTVPTKTAQGRLIAAANMPPAWNHSWLRHIPLISKTLTIMMNASRYTTTLEQNAELIAADLESRESKWSGATVGVIDASK
ncbi:hypothetical protein BDZ85DRAFT_59239 [Elsinoe ampelina]|uniref:NAD(P)-binding domain-containing protein n=1 Tax=Elsinoe ampelina TaxID=302913 RepID=A0A6A6GN27_9PEZI|nr:hypothetical protein BDZ85DRAFT_59239 [Elsinoe ampelina]